MSKFQQCKSQCPRGFSCHSCLCFSQAVHGHRNSPARLEEASGGYVLERPFPKKAVEKAANKKKPLIAPNSMIGPFNPFWELGNGLSGMIPVIACAPWQRVLKSRQPQSVPTMSTSLRWNHLSDHPLVQWGMPRGVSQETSLPRKGIFKKQPSMTFNILCYFNITVINSRLAYIFQSAHNYWYHPRKGVLKKTASQNGRESTNHRIWWDGRFFLLVDSRPFLEEAFLGTIFLERKRTIIRIYR